MNDPYAPHRSLASILALLAGIFSLYVHSGALGILLAVIAIVLGVIGFMVALLPGTQGAVLSIVAMLLGAIGAICGILRALFHLGQHLS